MNQLQTQTNLTPIEIALGIDEKGMTTARKLYEFLELNPGNYARWTKSNITENEFAEEGVDFHSSLMTSEGRGNFAEDYKLNAPFAKKLSMTAKNDKGEQAREYFIKAEDKLKEVVFNMDGIPTELQAIILHDKKLQLIVSHIEKADKKIVDINQDLQNFKLDMPLLGLETDKITSTVRTKGVNCLGGKNSNAYQNKSLRGKIYSDIYSQLKREFDVYSYKAIKRNQADLAVDIIQNYKLPFSLEQQVEDENSQLRMG